MALSPRHIDDIGGYIYFSPLSRGASGKPVKIHTNLFVDLFCAINPNTNEGQTIIRDIESLRAKMATDSLPKPAMGPLDCPRDSARHREQLNRARKLQRAMMEDQHMRRERVLTTRNARIYYHINQQPGDRVSTVYISEVQVVGTSDHEGGLYELKRGRRGVELQKTSNSVLSDRDVFLTGSSDNPKEAHREATILNNSTNSLVFFVPQTIGSQFRIGKTSRMNSDAKSLTKELTRLLRENQDNRVSWLVEGKGLGLLKSALNNLNGSLSKHRFKFTDAQGKLGDVIQKLSQLNATLDGEFISYSGNRPALLTFTLQKNKILDQLDKLPASIGYEKITRRYLKEQIGALSEISSAKNTAGQASSLRVGSKTMVEALIAAHGV
ncbi:hypothetical protein [Teredinibacter turnerae]|uniref:hypothetical protein n=1 Tax=Teredinibacter turnerae TaxID=2426 RepID=UPI000360EE47|nr:hypothetical protein [Teredinibacter turnerae]